MGPDIEAFLCHEVIIIHSEEHVYCPYEGKMKVKDDINTMVTTISGSSGA